MLTIYKDTITDRNKKFEKLVLRTQEEMKHYVKSRLGNHGKVIDRDGFVYYKGTFPVLLCAHLDTVHKELPRTLVYANGTLSSPQGIGGDDRCGVYMIFKILQKYDCSVVFLEDEEIGCVGAQKFKFSSVCQNLKKEKKLKYIIEFDRKDCNHAVTYDCANKEFDDFITKEFFKKEHGTCSDISYIAPELGIAAVNLSCGYYKEHHLEEWINLEEMEKVIVETMKILERTKELDKPFEYIKKQGYGRYGYGWDYGYDDNDDYYLSGCYNGYSGRYSGGYSGGYYLTPKSKTYKFTYSVGGSLIRNMSIVAKTEEAAYYQFFKIERKVCYNDLINVIEEK